MSGDESGGPAERDENTLVDRQPADEAWPPGGSATDRPGEGTALTTVTDEPLETETTAKGGPAGDIDPWPDLAEVTEEGLWDAAPASSASEPNADADADAATLPQPEPSSPGSDRRVAPQPPTMLELPVAMAAAAPRPQPAESAPEVPPPPSTAPPPPMSPPPMARPDPVMGTPPGGVPQPLGSYALPHQAPPGSGTRRPKKILIGIAAGLAVIVVGALAAVLLSGAESGRPATAASGQPKAAAPAASTAPSAAPSGAPEAGTAPTASGPPAPGAGQPVQPSGPVATPTPGAPGNAPAVPGSPDDPAMRYRTVQQDPGYFEGVLTFTNRTGAMMHAWEVSFTYPGANVKNIWDANLVRGGDHPVIRSLQNAEAIPPGGSLEIRFGAEGSPSAPQDCLFGGRACDFA